MQERSLDTMERAELLQLVREHGFMMTDLALYLDTHPTDRDAFSQFLKHKEEYRCYADAYAARFGAITKDQVSEAEGWASWSNTPWPWEKEAN